MRHVPPPLALCSFALMSVAHFGCASSSPTPSARSAAPTPRATVANGTTAEAVRAALGAPHQIERIPSSAAPGAVYERWRYPDRDVILLQGKVVDSGKAQ